jgi:phage/plasmid-associated DNA primase
VRHEFQCPARYDPNAREHVGLNGLLNQWWDPSERKAWLQFTAYGLSRTAFAEKLFILYGPGGSAKSSYSSLLIEWFGAQTVLMHQSSALLVLPPRTAAARDDQGKGHDSNVMACYSTALTGFPEPPTGGVLRDNVIKGLTGDQLAGRRAYAQDPESVKRTFTPFIVCNEIPRPTDPTDGAMMGRIELLTTQRVFYRNEQHKRDLESKMSAEQKVNCKMSKADPNVIPPIRSDPQAASYFVNLLIGAWKELICEQKCAFVPSTLAQSVTDNYWAKDSTTSVQDSVVTFLSDQVDRDGTTILPKMNLFLAYRAWHEHESRSNGSPGTLTEEGSFKVKVMRFYKFPTALQTTQKTGRMFDSKGGRLVLGNEQPKLQSYVGLKLKPHPSYETPIEAPKEDGVQ